MKTKNKSCAVCGAELTVGPSNRKYCSRACRAKAELAAKRKSYNNKTSAANRAFTQAWSCGHLTPNSEIMKARRKPRDVSDIRWRIELRRRASPQYYLAAGATC